MPWYAAHIVMAVKFKDGNQGSYPLWENVVLMEASSDDEALTKADIRGREGEGDSSGSFKWDDRPAIWVFAGVRKVISCQDPTLPPGDGTEITYSSMMVDDAESLKRFVDGDPVVVRYEE